MELSKPAGIGIAVAVVALLGGIFWFTLGRDQSSNKPLNAGGAPAQATPVLAPPDAGGTASGAPPPGAAAVGGVIPP